jgi:ABC-type transporter Mla maintaining outer membrane lipid asymmetry ATPase subunit MlaF
MIEIDGLTKRYGDKTVVDRLSFVVEPGVVTGFLGPNGAGKPITELRLSLPPGHARWTGARLALASAAVCRSRETAWHACPQDLPSSVAAQLPSDTDMT